MKRGLPLFMASSMLALAPELAHAQSTPTTCSPGDFDQVNVFVNGRTTTIESTPTGVLVNGVFCGWQDEISTLWVFGGALNDRVTFRGAFIPGNEFESDWDEIEVATQLGGGTDTVTLELSEGDEWVTIGGLGVNVNQDGDNDFAFDGAEVLKVLALGGDDIVRGDGSTVPTLYLYGGDGNDQVVGSIFTNDVLDGGPGNDDISAFDGDDTLIGGPGTDSFLGGAGHDTVDYRDHTAPIAVTIGNGLADDGETGEQENVPSDIEVVLGGKGNDVLIGDAGINTLDGGAGADLLDGGLGPDVLIGGTGNDTVDYSGRSASLNVAIGNGLPDDGEASEMDWVDITVENATGGAGNDTLVGSSSANTLRGGPGNDSLQGGDGNDKLYGDDGDDSLLGEAGADKLYGGDGSDVLDGGAGLDTFNAGAGNDFLYNDDGIAETVNCGPGNADDAEVDTGATDTFVGCEL